MVLKRSKKLTTKTVKRRKLQPKNAIGTVHAYNEDQLNEGASDASGDNSEADEATQHKRSLHELKRTDPEFYQFLLENDRQLLDFKVSDDEESVEAVHKAPDKLDVASDDSDYEFDDHQDEKKLPDGTITLKLLKRWQRDIQKDKSHRTIVKITAAFHAALITVSADDDDEKQQSAASRYIVNGASIFNGVIQLCVLELGPAVRRFLKLKDGKSPQKSKQFEKIKGALKMYFKDLHKIFSVVSSPSIQTVMLKHLHYMCNILVSLSICTSYMLRRLISLWSTATSDRVRVLAFFCLLRIVMIDPHHLDTLLRNMYIAYVRNSKFMSPHTVAMVNFMRRSLVEMYSLNATRAYHYVFVYLRQLAIHLRNFVILRKLEHRQAVCNWQYINSLRLWGAILQNANHTDHTLQPLIYPYIQVSLGTLQLAQSAFYIPMRFHLLSMLIDFCAASNIFVPILPHLVDTVYRYDFNKKHQKMSMKPIEYDFILRLSKSQMTENGFKDASINGFYELTLRYLANMSHTIAFPDLVVLPMCHLKQFLKACRNVQYTRKLRQLVHKAEENAKFIEQERERMPQQCTLADVQMIRGWEQQIRMRGTPLTAFYESFEKVRVFNKKREIAMGGQQSKSATDMFANMPAIVRPKNVGQGGHKDEADDEEFPDLFPSDNENDDLLAPCGDGEGGDDADNGPNKDLRLLPSSNQPGPSKKQMKKLKLPPLLDFNMDDGPQDEVQPMDLDDW